MYLLETSLIQAFSALWWVPKMYMYDRPDLYKSNVSVILDHISYHTSLGSIIVPIREQDHAIVRTSL